MGACHIKGGIAVEVKQRRQHEQRHTPARPLAAQIDKANKEHVQVQVNGHVPHTGRERVNTQQVVQEQGVCQPLAPCGCLGNKRVTCLCAGPGRTHHGKGQGRQQGQHQAQIPQSGVAHGMAQRQALVQPGRQPPCRQKAAHDQEHLHGNFSVVEKPVT